MADTLKRFSGPAMLTNAAVTQFTAGGAATVTIRNIHVSNGTLFICKFTLSIGTNAAGTRLFDQFPVQPYDVMDWSGLLVVNATEIVQAHADVNDGLVLTISGVETT